MFSCPGTVIEAQCLRLKLGLKKTDWSPIDYPVTETH